MSKFAFVSLAVNVFTCPFCTVFRRILVQTFPPYSIVVVVYCNVCEYSILLCSSQSVEIGFFACSRCNAEETCFRVYGIQSAVRTDSEPCDIVADCPNLIAFFLKIFRRNKHSKVGFTASRRESGTDILNFTLRIFQSQDEHVFSHPAFFHAEIRSNSECKALFTKQNVTAVC